MFNYLVLVLILKEFDLIKGNKKNEPKAKNSEKCTLTRRGSEDPYPSLSKCYKYNNEACCMSVHDDYINDYINKILSPSCVRKYPNFENLMCFGCHPLENKYIDYENNEIRICKSFAEDFWGGPLDQNSTKFDNCGFKVDDSEDSNECLKSRDGENYIIPSERFENFYTFMECIKIPFYEKYKIITQEDEDEFCYNFSLYINHINKLYFILSLIFFFI